MNTISYDDMDYIVYLDKDKRPIGFHITPDEIEALEIKYEAKIHTSFEFPMGTSEVLELLGIHTSVYWALSYLSNACGSPNTANKLLYYKPDFAILAKEIASEMDCAKSVDDFLKDIMTTTVDKCKYRNVDGTCFISFTTPCAKNCEGKRSQDFIGP